MKGLCLVRRVLAGGGVQHEEHLRAGPPGRRSAITRGGPWPASRMRLNFVCRRPAVSMMSTLPPRDWRRVWHRRRRRAGSAPAVGDDCTSTCLPQTVSCSMAAARKVSAAANSTLSSWRPEAPGELADAGGLARPLTPTTRMMAGMPGPGMRGQAVAWRGAKSAEASSWSAFWGVTSRRARARSQTSMARALRRGRRR